MQDPATVDRSAVDLDIVPLQFVPRGVEKVDRTDADIVTRMNSVEAKEVVLARLKDVADLELLGVAPTRDVNCLGMRLSSRTTKAIDPHEHLMSVSGPDSWRSSMVVSLQKI